MTVNVTAVNDAPAGADNTGRRPPRTRPTPSPPADFGFSDASDSPANSLAGRDASPRCPTAGTLTLNGVGRDRRPGRSPRPTSPPASCVFTPAANANGAAYASFTFQVQDNGGTANGGVDLDPTPNTMTINVDRGQRRAGRRRQHGARRSRTRPTRSPPPTSASPTQRQPGQQPRCGEDHHAAGRRHAAPSTASRSPRASAIAGRRHHRRQAACSRPAANANGTAYASFTFQVQDDGGTANGGVDLDASPEHASRSTSPRSTTRRPAPTTRSPSPRTRPTPSRPPTSASPIRTTARPTPCWRSRSPRCRPPARCTNDGVAVDRRPVRVGRPTSCRQLVFTPAANANGAGYAQLHLPGAGQRRHGQRRRRSRPERRTR